MASSSSFELEAERTPAPEPMEAALLESMPDPAPTVNSASAKEYPWQPMNKLSEPMASALKRAAEVAGTSKPSQEPIADAETTHQETASPAAPSWGSGQGAAAAPAPAKEPTPVAKTIEFKAPAAPTPAVAEEIPAPRQFEAPSFSTLAVKDHEQSAGEDEKKSPLLWVAVAAIVIAGSYFGWSKLHTGSSPTTTPSAPVQNQTPAPAATQPSATVVATPLPATSTEGTAPASQAPNSKSIKPSPAEGATTSNSKTSTQVSPVEPQPLVVKKDQPHANETKVAEVEAPEAPGVLGLGGNADKNAISGIVAGTSVAVPTVAAHTVKVSQGVSQGLITKRVQPSYPPQALQMRLQGAVQLQAEIGKDGSITAVKVLKGDSILSRAAAAAVKQWKYKPYFLNGEPVAVQTEVTVNFKLP
jgi:protein TonB